MDCDVSLHLREKDAKCELVKLINTLEQLLCTENFPFATKEECGTLIESVENAKKWLSQEGPTSDILAFAVKQEELQKLVDPILCRKKEYNTVLNAVEMFQKLVEKDAKEIRRYKKKKDSKINHLLPEEIDEAKKEIASVIHWFYNQYFALSKANFTEPLHISEEDVKKRKESYFEAITPLLYRPKI